MNMHTHQVAKAHEQWFHVRGVPGAHVLLRCDPGQQVEVEDVQFAADVAVYYSKARTVSLHTAVVIFEQHRILDQWQLFGSMLVVVLPC
jgi:predicted ribosome quality control (RQC) complex YloA/Tae2 family protein